MTDSPASYPFEVAWSFAGRTKGWLEPDEAELLYRLAGAGGNLGRVVELGSYCGRSSIMLAAGVAAASRGALVCVDTFGGSPEHQPGQEHFDPAIFVDGLVNTYPTFVRNLEDAGLLDRVEVVRQRTLDAAARFSAAIGLLFVDADHDYPAVRDDLQAWSPRVVDGGWIALHDVGQWSGPTRAAADLLEAGYKRHAQAGTVLALRRVHATQ
jgi:MMP 1-O-methyltransferase